MSLDCCNFYEVIVNNRAIILAEFFDLLGDVVNFIDIFYDPAMERFHPWALAIMALSAFSFTANTFFKKQLASVDELSRDSIYLDDSVELGLIEKSKTKDKLFLVSQKRKQVYENIAESMSIIFNLCIEDFVSFIFTIIVLLASGEVSLNAQMYNILITGAMITYQLFSLYVNRDNIIEQRKKNLRENMIVDFSSRLKQRRGDRRDEEYMSFVEKIRDELYLKEDSEDRISFRDHADHFKSDAFGNNFLLQTSVSIFEYFFKLYPSISVSDIYKKSDLVDPNESLLTIALDYGHYQIANEIYNKYGGLITKNWLAEQNNDVGGVSDHTVLFKLAMHMRPISLTPVYPWNGGHNWYEFKHWDENGEPLDESLIQLYNDQDKQIREEMNSPLCNFLIQNGVRRKRLTNGRETRKALNAMVYGDWDDVKKSWMDRGLSPVFDGYGPYQKYKREYRNMFLENDGEQSTERLDKNIEKFKEEYPGIDINSLTINQRWGVEKWWFNITILHDNILEKKFYNVKALIEKEGADPWKKTGAGENCLQIARTVKAGDIVKYFEENYPNMATK
jgi:hypothetical protein